MCRRAAAVPSSGFRRAVWLPAATWVEFAAQASWLVPAVAWCPLAAARMLTAREVAPPSELQAAEAESVKAVASAQPAASALRALLPRAEAAGVACVQAVQPQEAAGSGVRVQPPEAAVAASDAAAEPQQEAVVAAEPGAVLQPGEAAAEAVRAVEAQLPAVAAEEVRDAEVPLPAAEAPLVPWARRPAAERPAVAAWVYRPGLPLPWPAPRRAVRTAHAMWRSRAALPSKRWWQAARCEGLS